MFELDDIFQLYGSIGLRSEDPSILYLQSKHITSNLLAWGEPHVFSCRRIESKVWALEIHHNVRPWLDAFGFGGLLDRKKPMKLDIPKMNKIKVFSMME